tara:strand:+ start:301 stop:411 length:111 start_codon:yes stop_codon:yes gene_type:complete
MEKIKQANAAKVSAEAHAASEKAKIEGKMQIIAENH